MALWWALLQTRTLRDYTGLTVADLMEMNAEVVDELCMIAGTWDRQLAEKREREMKRAMDGYRMG